MLHKRCDIRDLLDSKISESITEQNNSASDEDEARWTTRVLALQEIRIGIFDEPYAPDDPGLAPALQDMD